MMVSPHGPRNPSATPSVILSNDTKGPPEVLRAARSLTLLARHLSGGEVAVSDFQYALGVLKKHRDLLDSIVGEIQKHRPANTPFISFTTIITDLESILEATRRKQSTDMGVLLANITKLSFAANLLIASVQPWAEQSFHHQAFPSGLVRVVTANGVSTFSILQQPERTLQAAVALGQIASCLSKLDFGPDLTVAHMTFTASQSLLKSAADPTLFRKRVGMDFDELVEELRAARAQAGNRTRTNTRRRSDAQIRTISTKAHAASALLVERVVEWITLARQHLGLFEINTQEE